jgi:hypothetical protein
LGNRQYSNNATTILAATITNVSTSIQASTGQGALFPTLSGSQYFTVAMQDTSGNIEFMKCTARSGDVLTVVRAQEGTTALAFTANLARFELRDTALSMSNLYQRDGDTLSGPMNMGGQNVTNGILGSGISIESATEIVNTPIRGATGITTNELVVPSDGTRATVGGLRILAQGDPIPAFTIGMVMMWNASIPDIPAGWHICDGTSGTPDLRDRFVLGAGGSHALGASGNLAETSGSTSAGTPTINGHSLTTAELATHNHPFDYSNANSTAIIGIPGFSLPSQFIFGGTGSGTRIAFAGTPEGSGTAHTHTASALAGHTHTIPGPPFYALYYIQFVGP